MAPKKKGKGKKGTPRKTTKGEYFEKIKELNGILAEERKQAKLVEDEFLATENKYETLQEDMADIIEYLEHEVKIRENEVANYENEIKAKKKEMHDQDEHYKKIFAAMDEEFEGKKKSLMEEFNLTNAKLNALDEIRHQMEEYLKRKEALDAVLGERKLKYQEEIYEAEKIAIIGKDKLQKEMDEKLKRLNSDFREATDVRIGAATKRILKQNINLNNKLTCMQQTLKEMRKWYENVKEAERKTILGLQLKEEECNLTQRKYEDQVDEIEELLDTHEKSTEKISNFSLLIKENKKLEKDIKKVEDNINRLQEELAALEKQLEEKQEISASAKKNFKKIGHELINLDTVLFNAALKVKDAIEVESSSEYSVEDEFDANDPLSQFQKEQLTEELKEMHFKKREDLINEVNSLLTHNVIEEEPYFMASSTEFYDLNLDILDRIHSSTIDRSKSHMISRTTP